MSSITAGAHLRTDARHRTILVVGVLVGTLFVVTNSTRAAPVTFRYEAEIGRISPGVLFDTGIDFAVGDVISGRFTFEPSAGDGGAVFGAPQPHEFILDINGSVISAPSFSITAANNLDRSIDGPGTNFFDSLSVIGSLSAVDGLGDMNFDSAAFTISLWAQASLPDQLDVLETASIPADAATWNQFVFRRLITVSFDDGDGRSITLLAGIAEFSAIPEPSTSSLLVSMLAIFATLTSRSSNYT